MAINFKQLDRFFKGMPAMDALEALCWVFNADRATIYIDGTRFALADLYDTMETDGFRQASEITLEFYGGPSPGKWWHGNLYTMFLDHFIFAYISGERQLVKKAFKFMVKVA